MEIIIFGIIILLLLILSGWLSAIFGLMIRRFYFFLGMIFGGFAEISLVYLGLSVFLLSFSFWFFNRANRMIENNQAYSHVPTSVSLSMSGFGFGFFLGVIIMIIRFFI
jgi:hypothetical protein